jgi:hypothetical protein
MIDIDESDCYEIRVRGQLEASWSDWFEGLELHPEPSGEMVLRGRLRDQAELHSVLLKIRDLGLPLIGLERIKGEE